MHNLSPTQEGTVSCVRITFFDKLVQTLQPWTFANPAIAMELAPGTAASSVTRLVLAVRVSNSALGQEQA